MGFLFIHHQYRVLRLLRQLLLPMSALAAHATRYIILLSQPTVPHASSYNPPVTISHGCHKTLIHLLLLNILSGLKYDHHIVHQDLLVQKLRSLFANESILTYLLFIPSYHPRHNMSISPLIMLTTYQKRSSTHANTQEFTQVRICWS